MITKKAIRILLVDDDDAYKTSEVELLRLEGYETAEASSAAQAKERLRASTFHLALIDNRMCDETGEFKSAEGMRLANWMKEHYPLTSRIIVTTLEDVEFVKTALRAGWVDDYYSKDDIATGRIDSLTSIVERALESRVVSAISASEYPHNVDPLYFWGEEGVVEKEVAQAEPGSVRFGDEVMKACVWPGSGMTRIRKGHKGEGRAVTRGSVEVVPLGHGY